MRKVFVSSLLFLYFFVSVIALAHASGQIVFTKAEYTREGFEDAMSPGRSSGKGWWELYRRDICVMNSDGTGLNQLTDDGVSYRPEWSPDGQKIAFYSGPPPTVDLNVMDSDGANRRELVSNQTDIYDFIWSPDSSKILVYVKTRNPREPEEAWVVAVDGTTNRMGSSKWARGWNHWTPEGAEVINPDRRLLAGLPEGVAWPEWSWDGKYIAFVYEKRLAIADTTVIGKPEDWRASKLEPPCNRIVEWSPDNMKILFLVRGNVCSINFDGKDVLNLSMSNATDACWSKDGSQIAYTTTDGRKGNTEIFIMNADGTGHKQLTNTSYFHTDVDWR